MKKNIFLTLVVVATLAMAVEAEGTLKSSAAVKSNSKLSSNSNAAAEHSRQVNEQIAADKAANATKTKELQKKHADEVQARAMASGSVTRPAKPTANKAVAKPVAKKPTAAETTTPTSAPTKASTVAPRRDLATAKTTHDMVKAEKQQHAGNTKPVAKSDTKNASTASATSTKLTNEQRVADMNQRNAAAHATEKEKAANNAKPVSKPATKEWPKGAKIPNAATK